MASAIVSARLYIQCVEDAAIAKSVYAQYGIFTGFLYEKGLEHLLVINDPVYLAALSKAFGEIS